MQRILLKRTLRDLKTNLLRYLALFLLIALCMFIVIGIVGSAQSVIKTVNNHAEQNHLEDGQFGVFMPLSEQDIAEIESYGVTLEAGFYLDFQMEDGSTLRFMKNREKINLIDMYDGEPASSQDQIAMERIYAAAHGIQIGDTITVAGKEFTVSGIATSPDYDYCLQNTSDMSADGSVFGTAFVTEEAYEALSASGQSLHTEEYRYSYLLGDRISDTVLKHMLMSQTTNGIQELADGPDELLETLEQREDKTDNLIDFMTASNNPRIKAANDDVAINQSLGIFAGVIVIILITYVMSVFVVHSIDRESPMIGALYALGAKRRQLMLHYTMLPVLLCLVGGAIGTAIGYSQFGIYLFVGESFSYYSMPKPEIAWNPLLLIYGVLVPPAIAYIVHTIIIRKRLSQTALSLLRKEQKNQSGKELHLRGLGYIRTFQIRQFFRERRSSFAVLAGMFVSMLVLMLGLTCYAVCDNIQTNTASDVQYEYMYLYKYPAETVPEDGYEAYIEEVKKETMGYDMEVTIIGLTEENPFFPTIHSSRKNEISISTSVAQKYNLSVGDSFTLEDEVNETVYSFEIVEIVPYSAGLCAFMDIDSMRELWGQEEDYFNAVYSTQELEVDSGRLYSVSSRTDAVKSAGIFMENMTQTMITLITAAIVIFLVVLYQMMKVMIDRSAQNISLMKIFGYRNQEIRKLYLDGNFILIAVGSILVLPICKFLTDAVYPYLVANVAGGIDLSWKLWMYFAVYAGILASYMLIQFALMHQIKKTSPAELLKDRE